MIRHFSSLFIVLFYISQVWADDALTYCIQSASGKQCSATLIKVDGKCHLVTNAHCVDKDNKKVTIKSIHNYMPTFNPDFIPLQQNMSGQSTFSTRDSTKKHLLWNFEKQFFDESYSAPLESKVIIADHTKDLALLEVPKHINENACQKLKTIAWLYDDKSTIKSKQSVMSIGCTRENRDKEHHPKVSYTIDTLYLGDETKPNFQPTAIERVPSAFKDSDHLYYVKDLAVTPGQSGGTTVTQSGGFLGIQTRSNLTQDRAWIIPSQDVLSYIRAPSASDGPNPYDVASIVVSIGDGDGTGTGDGDGTGTGDGDGTGTGDGDGTGTGDDCKYVHSSLEFFTTKEDQFLEQIGDILISVEGKILNEPGEISAFGQNATRIPRDADGYPSLEIRKQTLEKLTGQFEFPESVHKIASRTNDQRNWSMSQRGELGSNIEVTKKSEKEYSIDLNFEQHQGYIPRIQFFETTFTSHPGSTKTFKAKYSDDYKTITLTRNGETLTCHNKHYLKLFCQGANKSLSISASDVTDIKSGLRYRYAEADSTISHYYYGER